MQVLKNKNFLIVCLCICVVSCSTLVIDRTKSVLEDYEYSQTTGAEAPGLYGVYKVYKSDTLYHDIKENRTSFLFNYGFYEVYGSIAQKLADKAELVPLYARLLTLFLCLLLVLCSSIYTFGHYSSILLSSLLVISPTAGWSLLTARPDLPAAVITFSSICIGWKGWKKSSNILIAISGVIASTAPIFKQTYVLFPIIYLSLLIYNKKLRSASVLSVSALSLLLFPLIYYGGSYYTHAVTAAGLPPLSVNHGVNVLGKALMKGFYVYIPVLVMLFWRSQRLRRKLMGLALLSTLLFLVDFIASMRLGSATNYFFPSFTLSLFTVVAYIDNLLCNENKDDLDYIGLLVACLILGLSVAPQLYRYGYVGVVDLSTEAQNKKAQMVSRSIQRATGKSFVGPSYQALPWISGQYPTEAVSWTIYPYAVKKGLFKPIEHSIESSKYRNFFVRRRSIINKLNSNDNYKFIKKVDNLHHFREK